MSRADDRMMRQLAAAQHGLVARRQLRDAGMSRQAIGYRLRSPDWEAVTSRVLRLAGSQATGEQRALAAVLDAGGGAVVSHRSAAALWAIPGFDLRVLHLSRGRTGTDRPSALAVLHHPRSLPDGHRTVRNGVPVTTVARTVADLAGSEHRARTELALNAALRMGIGWKALETTVFELESRGRPGSGVARALLDANRGRRPFGSGLEGRVVRILLAAGLPEPRRQVDLGGEHWEGRVDLVYDDVHLVVEVDGDAWHGTPWDVRRDKRRTASLVAAGFRVLPVSEDLIRNAPDELVRLVREARRRRPTGTGR